MAKIDAASARFARLAGQRVYIDTNLFIYFLDRHPVYFSAVAALFQASMDQVFFATTGDVAVAEVMVGPYRHDDPSLAARCKQFFAQSQLLTVVAHQRQVFDSAAQLSAKKRMKFIDALHVATAIDVGCTAFITNDMGVPSVQGLDVIQLADLLG
jgi:predicted nucleic acid-binding protein